MNSEKKLFLPDAILFKSSVFYSYVNDLRNRLYDNASNEMLIEKSADEHRAFRLLPLLLIQDEALWDMQIKSSEEDVHPAMRRAIAAVLTFLTEESIGHQKFKESLKEQTRHLSGKLLPLGLKSDEQINDAKNLWKDLATFRYSEWKKCSK